MRKHRIEIRVLCVLQKAKHWDEGIESERMESEDIDGGGFEAEDIESADIEGEGIEGERIQ